MMLIVLFTLVLSALYFYYTRKYRYWKKRNIKYEEPTLFFGTNKTVYFAKQSKSQLIEDMYWKYPNEKVVGGFKSTTPELVIRDPELIRNVLIRDFTSFYLRGLNPSTKYFEPLRKNLFSTEGDLWRMLRQRLTPAFTSGKLKAMFPLIMERTERLRAQAKAAAIEKRSIDVRNLMACYTTDVIGAIGFGIEADSLNNDESEFRKLGREIFKTTTRDNIVRTLTEMFPRLCKTLKFFERIEKSLFDLVKEIQTQRGFKPSNRHDFIDLLLECQKKGPMEAISIESTDKEETPKKVSTILDDALIAAQVFVFFGAGFETSSSSTSYTLHQLAYNPEVQEKVQENIDEVLSKYNNVLCYDSIKDMTYLEWAFKEGLRMFPSLGYLMRKSSKNYTFDEIGLDIDEGVSVFIPVQGLHMDPKYWDNPEEFRPERFHPDNFTSTQKLIYYPFGEGPRNCIGSRLGLMQSIAGLAAILSKFSVIPAPESVKYFEVNPRSNVVQGVKGTLPLLFVERKTSYVEYSN